MKRELKIGIFVTIALIIIGTAIFIVGDLSVLFRKPGYSLNVVFDTVAGLEKRAVVRMAGVKIGYVKDIRLQGSRANILLIINSGIEVPRGSRATLASLGLLGEKHVELLPGAEPGICQPGETLEGVPPVSFDQMGTMLLSIGNEFKEMSRIISELIGGEESRDNFRNTLSNLSTFSADLREFFAVNKEELHAGIQSSSQAVQKFDKRVEEVSRNIDELIFMLKDVVEENRENIKINLNNIQKLIKEIEQSLKLLNESLEKINKGEGTLGMLISQPELYARAEDAMGEIERLIYPVSNLRFSGDLRAEYYGKSNLVKNYFTLGIWPTEKKFVLAQVIHDPWLDKFVYSSQFGLRWGGFTSRVGIMESKVGLGVDYYAFGDRLRFSLDVFDFNRHPRPHFRFWTRFVASKYFNFLVGVENFTLAPRREVYFGLGIGF
ncbi:MAG: MCE family protein [Candidatus Aminicenantes bacterium]|nr:MCE family protein [Candidatus Aminicenantes bacterium]